MLNTILELSAFIGILGLGYILVLKNFNLTIYILLLGSVLLHKELFSFYRWDLLPIRALMFGVLLAALTKFALYVKTNKKFPGFQLFIDQPFLLMLTILWVVRGLSILFSFNLEASVLLFGFFTTVVALGILLLGYLKGQPEKALSYLKFYIYVAFGLSLFGFVQYFYHFKTGKVIGSFWVIPGNIPRVGSLFWDVNHYGALIAALVPVSAVLVLIEKKALHKILFAVITVSLSISLVLTNSRTSLLMDGVAVAIFVGILFLRKFGRKGVLFVMLLFVFLSLPPILEYNRKGSAFREKVKQYLNYRVDSSDSHFLLILGAYQIFEEYPILGGGYGSFFEHFGKTQAGPLYYGRDPAALTNRVPAHTIWGELIAETGIIGLSVFILLIGIMTGSLGYLALRSTNKSTYLLSSAMLGVVLGWMVSGIFYSYNAEFFWLIMFLFFGFGYAELHREFTLNQVVSYFAKSVIPFATVFFIAAFLIFVKLGSVSLIPWDDAIYAKIAKNMVYTNEYITQNWVPGKVWYEKPPLFMWLVAMYFKLFGFTDFAAKLPSALAGLGTVMLVFVFAKRFFGKTAGFIAAFSLVTTVQYLFYSRMAMTDVLCAFFMTASLAIYYSKRFDSQLNFLTILISGLFVGLAVMTKGVVGLIPLAVMGLYEIYLLFSRQQEALGKSVLHLFGVLLVSAVIFMPWHYRMFQLYGNSFLNNYIGYHVFARATEDIENKEQPIYWYIIILKVSMRLWFISLLGALPYSVVSLYKSKNTKTVNSLAFILIWAGFIFAFFSVPTSKLIWYIIPLYIPLAVLNGYFVSSIYNHISQKFELLQNSVVKFLLFYIFGIVILGYTFLVRNMIYVPDSTGSIARLLKLKDTSFGIEQFAYLDRVDLPLAYYYTDGKFKIIDFNAEKPERIPQVGFDDKLVMLTKKGRFVDKLPQYDYYATVVKEDGDYILWYYESKRNYYTSALEDANKRWAELSATITQKYKVVINAPLEMQQEYSLLVDKVNEYSDILMLHQ
ncbi:phospholipid carrier-dependent glycosyltransferase [candidate division WWE3 bacterium]|uniref:Phospholipid carrier-dependent glycosyltransferase n=1 Tax=candidate division WWE3 bacterium TaxID=2053526 RepID=A0A7X9DK44_UNCKA|nr:phospholipid carrier-dependent glycosyltransferase [candidate division WWE3 bacterium]